MLRLASQAGVALVSVELVLVNLVTVLLVTTRMTENIPDLLPGEDGDSVMLCVLRLIIRWCGEI